MIEADLVADFDTWQKTTWRSMAGAELLIAGSFPARVGYRRDSGADSQALSLGTGYVDTGIAAEIGVRRRDSGGGRGRRLSSV